MQHTFTIDGQTAEAWLSRKEDGYRLICGEARHDVALTLGADARGMLAIDGIQVPIVLVMLGDSAWIHIDGAAHEIVLEDPVLLHAHDGESATDDVIRAPMPGAVIAVHIEVGAAVKANDPLLIIESMKLETVIKAPRDGVVEVLGVANGQSFDRDAVLIQLAKEED